MLVLARRVGEAIRIGDDITVIVLSIKGNQIRIGTDAPEEVAVHREEIYERLQEKPVPKIRRSSAGSARSSRPRVG